MPRHLRIFLSSPGDVNEERALAQQVIEQVAADPSFRGKVTLEALAWDMKGVPLLATLTPQEAINQGLPRPSECDIVVVIFWARMGTPLPPEYVKPDGARYLSGTEWEYLDAITAAASTHTPPCPQVIVYRRTEEIVLKPSDPAFMQRYEQWQRVEEFFRSFINPDGSIRQGYNTYQTPDDFRQKFETHLRALIPRFIEGTLAAEPGAKAIPSGVTSEDLRLLGQVELAPEEWERSGRNDAFIWPHERLAPVYALIERVNPDLDATTRAFIRPEIERLLEELNEPATSPIQRAVIGERLAQIGDTRLGVGLRDGIPDPAWCDVPGGTVTLDGDGTYTVRPFRIARYPVTLAQYRAFVEGGYYEDEWWEGVNRSSAGPGKQSRDQANLPAESVSWYDAVAFCRWLSAQIGFTVRLPTEWEWQQAASGGDAERIFTWGNTWDAERANTLEAGIGRTMAVGMYPHGASPVGALDMLGNVWEWCLNHAETPDVLAIPGGAKRALRGGGWSSGKAKARVRNRTGDRPSRRQDFIGFRLAAELD